MDYTVIAIIAAVVNLTLSILVPCLFKKISLPKSQLMPEIKKMVNNNQDTLLISSLLVGVIVFLSLETPTPSVSDNEMIELGRLLNLGNFDLADMSNMSNMSNMSKMSRSLY
jgi:hypothetical protein